MRPITALRSHGMPIGELSGLTGVNVETIRYYEKIKMLPAPVRTEGGHRGLRAKRDALTPIHTPWTGARVHSRSNPRVA